MPLETKLIASKQLFDVGNFFNHNFSNGCFETTHCVSNPTSLFPTTFSATLSWMVPMYCFQLTFYVSDRQCFQTTYYGFIYWKQTLENIFGKLKCMLETLFGYWKHEKIYLKHTLCIGDIKRDWKHNFSLETTSYVSNIQFLIPISKFSFKYQILVSKLNRRFQAMCPMYLTYM